MARTISIADDVFEWLKKEKGDRSYSEVIRDMKKSESDFSKFNGINITGFSKVEETVEEASEGSMKELEEMFGDT